MSQENAHLGGTQTTICQQTFLPKQTVNAIIKTFLEKGIIVLTEMDSDRRNKVIRLTESGKEYTEKIILKTKNAEYSAVEKLEPEQRRSLIENTKLFRDNLRDCMRGE